MFGKIFITQLHCVMLVTPLGTHPPPKYTFGCIERKSTLLGVSCGCVEGIKRAREGTASPLCPPQFAAATVFFLSGRTADIIKHAKFQVNRFRDFGAPWVEFDPPPIDLAHRLYNSVRTNVLRAGIFLDPLGGIYPLTRTAYPLTEL